MFEIFQAYDLSIYIYVQFGFGSNHHLFDHHFMHIYKISFNFVCNKCFMVFYKGSNNKTRKKKKKQHFSFDTPNEKCTSHRDREKKKRVKIILMP